MEVTTCAKKEEVRIDLGLFEFENNITKVCLKTAMIKVDMNFFMQGKKMKRF